MRDPAFANPSLPENEEKNHNHKLAQAILQALHGLRFGSVEITIHDAKVVQIERIEKIRFDSAAAQRGR